MKALTPLQSRIGQYMTFVKKRDGLDFHNYNTMSSDILSFAGNKKTELSEFLAKEFGTISVPEFAREYIEKLKIPYTYEDVEYIDIFHLSRTISAVCRSYRKIFK